MPILPGMDTTPTAPRRFTDSQTKVTGSALRNLQRMVGTPRLTAVASVRSKLVLLEHTLDSSRTPLHKDFYFENLADSAASQADYSHQAEESPLRSHLNDSALSLDSTINVKKELFEMPQPSVNAMASPAEDMPSFIDSVDSDIQSPMESPAKSPLESESSVATPLESPAQTPVGSPTKNIDLSQMFQDLCLTLPFDSVQMPSSTDAATITVLTPVKANRKYQTKLGVGTVVTPVKRSLRISAKQSTDASIDDDELKTLDLLSTGQKVQMLLQKHGYAYVPNQNVEMPDLTYVKTVQKDIDSKLHVKQENIVKLELSPEPTLVKLEPGRDTVDAATPTKRTLKKKWMLASNETAKGSPFQSPKYSFGSRVKQPNVFGNDPISRVA